MSEADPFRHHPELRDLIEDPESSFFRTFQPSDFDAEMAENGLTADWRHSDEERERCRRQTFVDWPASHDLWVFAYGSLMWNPAMRFEEVRRAHLPGYARKFCLVETLGGRGSRDYPGLLAGLDHGAGCDGLVFRIAADAVDRETELLWRRERFREGYRPIFVEVSTDQGAFHALTFLANPDAPDVDLDIPRARQIEMLATGEGSLGSCLEYLANLVGHLTALGIEDADLSALLRDARAHKAMHHENRHVLNPA